MLYRIKIHNFIQCKGSILSTNSSVSVLYRLALEHNSQERKESIRICTSRDLHRVCDRSGFIPDQIIMFRCTWDPYNNGLRIPCGQWDIINADH